MVISSKFSFRSVFPNTSPYLCEKKRAVRCGSEEGFLTKVSLKLELPVAFASIILH